VKNCFAAAEDGADVLLLDDGFQHLRLLRDLDLVVVDATCPFGGGRLLPAGMLREPPTALARADAVILTHSDQVSAGQVEIIREKLRRYARDALLLTAVHRPARLTDLNGNPRPLGELSGRRVAAISGIGRPDTFVTTLRDLGAEVGENFAYPDHHVYDGAEVRHKLGALAPNWIPLTTEKDAQKLREVMDDHWRSRIGVVGIELRVSGLPQLRERIERMFKENLRTK
jgi:tetraacyldisaccharide 4'-kinase